MSAFWQDATYAARALRKAPGFTFVAVVVLALGIGANAAIFSLVDAALLRPLPFIHPERLVMLWERSTRFAHNRVAPLNFLDWSEQQHAFASVAAIAGGGRTLTGNGGEAERIACWPRWAFSECSVGRRAREFGIRLALGARTHDVLRLVLGSALEMTAAGVAIGLAAAAVLTRFLGALLFAVKPTDPATFLVTAAVLASAALVACALPAWRATRVDPVVTLRQE